MINNKTPHHARRPCDEKAVFNSGLRGGREPGWAIKTKSTHTTGWMYEFVYNSTSPRSLKIIIIPLFWSSGPSRKKFLDQQPRRHNKQRTACSITYALSNEKEERWPSRLQKPQTWRLTLANWPFFWDCSSTPNNYTNYHSGALYWCLR